MYVLGVNIGDFTEVVIRKWGFLLRGIQAGIFN